MNISATVYDNYMNTLYTYGAAMIARLHGCTNLSVFQKEAKHKRETTKPSSAADMVWVLGIFFRCFLRNFPPLPPVSTFLLMSLYVFLRVILPVIERFPMHVFQRDPIRFWLRVREHARRIQYPFPGCSFALCGLVSLLVRFFARLVFHSPLQSFFDFPAHSPGIICGFTNA